MDKQVFKIFVIAIVLIFLFLFFFTDLCPTWGINKTVGFAWDFTNFQWWISWIIILLFVYLFARMIFLLIRHFFTKNKK